MNASTPRDRWMALFRGARADRLPCDYWGTLEVTERLKRDLGCASDRALWERLGVDKMINITPKPPAPSEDGTNVWGVRYQSVAYGDGLGSYTEPASQPLAYAQTAADVERYPWPSPDRWDTRDLRQRMKGWEGYPILGGSYEPFLLYCTMRGLEQAMQDLVLNPEVAEAALERIYIIHEAVIRRAIETAGDLFQFVYVAEDLGSQESLLMSPASFRTFIKPRMARMIDLVHRNGKLAFHHDDGAIRKIIPELLEVGIDILNPIQWRCPGMDRKGLARDFGDRLVFHGAVDNQQTLPFGKPEDVRREVRENVAIFGKGRGYVIAPCHNLQPNTPTANIVALYEAAHEFGVVRG